MAVPSCPIPASRYQVFILKDGYHKLMEREVRASGNITLIVGPHNVLIGTGMPQDKDLLLKGLQEHNMGASSIEYVVCTQGHVENVGNLNLFPDAVHIIGQSVAQGDRFIMHDFNQNIPYEIDDDLQVFPSPGHVPAALTVMVGNTQLGTVAIAGGAFYSEEDLENPDLWEDCSLDPETQQQSRIDILKMADFIVPRYGGIFRVPDTYKGPEMKVVMTP